MMVGYVLGFLLIAGRMIDTPGLVLIAGLER